MTARARQAVVDAKKGSEAHSMAKLKLMRVGVLVYLASTAFAGDDARTGYPSLDVFRLQAIRVVLPTYPSSSLAQHHSGTAVVELLVSPKGTVSEVKVLEAPDDAIGVSVSHAATQWTFYPLVTRDNVAHPMKGRLIFYFQIKKGRPSVVDVIAKRINESSDSKTPP